MTPPVHATKRGVNSLGGQCHGGEHVGFIVRHSPTPRSSEQALRWAPTVHGNPSWPARVSKPGAGDRFGPELPPGLRAPRTALGRPRAFTGRPETRRSHRSRSRRKSAYWECCRSSDSAISRPCHRVRKSRRRTPPSGRLSLGQWIGSVRRRTGRSRDAPWLLEGALELSMPTVRRHCQIAAMDKLPRDSLISTLRSALEANPAVDAA